MMRGAILPPAFNTFVTKFIVYYLVIIAQLVPLQQQPQRLVLQQQQHLQQVQPQQLQQQVLQQQVLQLLVLQQVLVLRQRMQQDQEQLDQQELTSSYFSPMFNIYFSIITSSKFKSFPNIFQ
jgi:hypothetical protein